MVVRDGLSTRDACNAVDGATQHSKAGKYAHRIRELLSDYKFAAEFAVELMPTSTQVDQNSANVKRWHNEQPPRLQEDFGGSCRPPLHLRVVLGPHTVPGHRYGTGSTMV